MFLSKEYTLEPPGLSVSGVVVIASSVCWALQSINVCSVAMLDDPQT
ncbi:MAG: hypothetical protein OFPI_30060 [Osedax symbiont Rs2]|nr:MAG: hypothetical protein OFPI_30060 [Osedax symbiont Rs2]